MFGELSSYSLSPASRSYHIAGIGDMRAKPRLIDATDKKVSYEGARATTLQVPPVSLTGATPLGSRGVQVASIPKTTVMTL